MNYLSVCSGIEAASVAWEKLGWTPIAFSKIEPFPSAVLAHHYPKIQNLGDMTKFQDWTFDEPVDVLVGGTPCQSFSVAGLRQGLADPRGNLMLIFIAIAQRFRPQWIVWENVPGVLSSNRGRDFGTFLRALVELGYGFAYRVLDAQWFGVAQRRRRVFVVGYLGDWQRPAKVLFESESVRRDSPPSREAREKVATRTRDGAEVGGRWWDGSDVAATLTKQNANGAQRMPDKDNFGAVLQPVGTDCYNGAITGDVAATIGTPGSSGNAVEPMKDIAPCLTNWDRHGVAQPISFGAQMSKQQTGVNLVPTLQATNRMAVVVGALDCRIDAQRVQNALAGHIIPISIQGNLIGRNEGGPQGVGASGDNVMYTLTKVDVHGVAQPVAEIAPTISSSGPPYSRTGNARVESNALAIHAMKVRRLTPVECERLQGFPDNYTNIPWRGKPEAPDGPRYKALGNSMAVPVMQWIGQRIQKQSENLRSAA